MTLNLDFIIHLPEKSNLFAVSFTRTESQISVLCNTFRIELMKRSQFGFMESKVKYCKHFRYLKYKIKCLYT